MIGKTNIGVENLSALLTTQSNLITNITDVLNTKCASDNGKYVWEKWSISGTTKLEFIEYVVSDNNAEYPADGIKDGYYYKFIITQAYSWANATDAMIVSMIAAADVGELDLSQYWAVGDERTVHLSAMSATGVGESHAEQDVKFVILNKGGKILSNGKECNFIVGLKNTLKESGYMNPSNTNEGSWNGCARRTWCNNTFKNSIPTTLLPIFKQHINKTATRYNDSSLTDSTDWFAFAAEFEVFGSITYSSIFEGQGSLSQFEYYKTSANRVKTYGEGVDNKIWWWERSLTRDSSAGFCVVTDYSGAYNYSASNIGGLAPFGCI